MERSEIMLDQKRMDLFEKIAKLSAQGVQASVIAQVVGLKESELFEEMQTEEFRSFAAPHVERIVEEQLMVNEGWDSVEQQALGTVLEHLKHRLDPDFALRAAMIANKAVKRNTGNRQVNEPLAMQAGARVTINLNAQFVNAVGNMQTQKRDFAGIAVSEKKSVDMLSTADVDKMLSGPIELSQEDLDKMVNN